jgi:hypothetical protein
LQQAPAIAEAIAEARRAERDVTAVRNECLVVAIVVLSHNDRGMALRYLDGIATLTYRLGAFFVVLVENSTPTSRSGSASPTSGRAAMASASTCSNPIGTPASRAE